MMADRRAISMPPANLLFALRFLHPTYYHATMNGGELLPIVVNGAGKSMGGTVADLWRGIVGDRVLAWRIANAAKTEEKLNQKLTSRGLTLNRDKLPDGVIFSWFQKATEADEPEIQELFAQLLINAGLGNEDAQKKRNIELVSSLSPEDARLLQIFRKMFAFDSADQPYNATIRVRRDPVFYQRLKAEGFEDRTSIDALISLGILRQERCVAPNNKVVNQIATLPIGNSRTLPAVLKAIALKILDTSDDLVVTTVGLSLLQALREDDRLDR